jgi:hypothetical protein
MNLRKRIEAVEAALSQQCGEMGFKLIHRAAGESEEQAKARAGLADWSGAAIFIGFPYKGLPQYQTKEDTE